MSTLKRYELKDILNKWLDEMFNSGRTLAPDGNKAIKMKDITQLLDRIEELYEQEAD